MRTPVRLSELFEKPEQTLILLHVMYGKKQEKPSRCARSGPTATTASRPTCASARASRCSWRATGGFADYARSRGWRNLRIVSAAGSDLERRLGFEEADGQQNPGVSVFRRDAGGGLVHTCSVSATFGPGQLRRMDLLSPSWSFLALAPEGRGEFSPKRRSSGPLRWGVPRRAARSYAAPGGRGIGWCSAASRHTAICSSPGPRSRRSGCL